VVETDPLVGASLSHFRVEARLGAGGMGVVYRALDTKLKRMVALKVLPSKDSTDPERRALLLREARAAAAINHPNLAAIYEIDEEGALTFIAMELVTGRSVRQLLGEGQPLPVDAALSIARQVAQALQCAHTAGLVHRDLKPDNVMVGEDGSVKLLDFGLAKRTAVAAATDDTGAPISREGVAMGTPGYMAPEQARGSGVDHRADFFAFGAMLYEMLTGARPFAGESVMELMIASVRDPAPRLSVLRPDLPEELSALVASLLEKEAERRPASASQIIAALGGPGRLTPTAAPEAFAQTLATRRPPRRRAPLVLGGFLSVGVLLLGVRWLVPHHVAVTDFPAEHASPELARRYAIALQNLRDGDAESALANLNACLAIDPTFGPAHLRIAVYSEAGGDHEPRRKHLAAAAQVRPTLSDRDRALLGWAQKIELIPMRNASQGLEKSRELVRRFSDDAELTFLGASHAAFFALDPRETLPDFDAATRLDPEYVAPHVLRSAILDWAGDPKAALREVEDCLRVLPGAVACMNAKARIETLEGRCQDFEVTARRRVQVAPTQPMGHLMLAEALAANGAPIESIRASLDRFVAASTPADSSEARLGSDVRISILKGDFEAARSTLHEIEKLRANDVSEDTHAAQTEALMELAEETGDWRESLRIAADYIRRLDSWEMTRAFSVIRLRWLYLARRAGELTDAELVAEKKAMEERDRDARFSGDGAEAKWDRWVLLEAGWAETPEDITHALASRPTWQPPGLQMTDLPDLLLHVAAGSGVEVLPQLKRFAGSCRILPSGEERNWLNTIRFFRAQVALGSVLEQQGDAAGACAAYRTVLHYWNDSPAHPRSLTISQERMKALNCP
jgi:serine/threonine-protein kinase